MGSFSDWLLKLAPPAFLVGKMRKQELLKRKKQALEKISKAKKVMGDGDWRGAAYETADMEIRIWSERLAEIEKELRGLKKYKGR